MAIEAPMSCKNCRRDALLGGSLAPGGAVLKKAAASDALKKCASLIGIGLYVAVLLAERILMPWDVSRR